MATWSDPSASLQPDLPARASLFRQIQENITAVTEGAVGAPRVSPAALSASPGAGSIIISRASGGPVWASPAQHIYDGFTGETRLLQIGGAAADWAQVGTVGVDGGRRFSSALNAYKMFATQKIKLDGAADWDFTAYVTIENFGSNQVRWCVGCLSEAAIFDYIVSGLYFFARGDEYGNKWQIGYSNGAFPTVIDTGVSITASMVKLRIIYLAGVYYFEIDDADVGGVAAVGLTGLQLPSSHRLGISVGQDGSTTSRHTRIHSLAWSVI